MPTLIQVLQQYYYFELLFKVDLVLSHDVPRLGPYLLTRGGVALNDGNTNDMSGGVALNGGQDHQGCNVAIGSQCFNMSGK